MRAGDVEVSERGVMPEPVPTAWCCRLSRRLARASRDARRSRIVKRGRAARTTPSRPVAPRLRSRHGGASTSSFRCRRASLTTVARRLGAPRSTRPVTGDAIDPVGKSEPHPLLRRGTAGSGSTASSGASLGPGGAADGAGPGMEPWSPWSGHRGARRGVRRRRDRRQRPAASARARRSRGLARVLPGDRGGLPAGDASRRAPARPGGRPVRGASSGPAGPGPADTTTSTAPRPWVRPWSSRGDEATVSIDELRDRHGTSPRVGVDAEDLRAVLTRGVRRPPCRPATARRSPATRCLPGFLAQ